MRTCSSARSGLRVCGASEVGVVGRRAMLRAAKAALGRVGAAKQRCQTHSAASICRQAMAIVMLCIRCGAEPLSASPTPSRNDPAGAYMKFSISYKHVDSHEAVEEQSARYLNKLNRLLKSYQPDLVQLHGVFARNPHNQEHSFSLNLSLPTGTLHATGSGGN